MAYRSVKWMKRRRVDGPMDGRGRPRWRCSFHHARHHWKSRRQFSIFVHPPEFHFVELFFQKREMKWKKNIIVVVVVVVVVVMILPHLSSAGGCRRSIKNYWDKKKRNKKKVGNHRPSDVPPGGHNGRPDGRVGLLDENLCHVDHKWNAWTGGINADGRTDFVVVVCQCSNLIPLLYERERKRRWPLGGGRREGGFLHTTRARGRAGVLYLILPLPDWLTKSIAQYLKQ